MPSAVLEKMPIEVAPLGPTRIGTLQTIITAFILITPLVGIIFAAATIFGKETTIASLALGVGLYVFTGHGLSAGFHRMATHRAFRAHRFVKCALLIGGSLAFEGGVLSWVANHRQHHAYTDTAGDPHSPHLCGETTKDRFRGAVHAHVGWLFTLNPTEVEKWAPDLLSDRDVVVIDRLFPLWCVVSLALPTLLGLLISGTFEGALGGLVWGGLVRVFVLQHATFAVNSACHLWGKQPFATRESDQARNLAILTVVAMGDNWHNLHHAIPRLARHGVDRHQWDSTARLIRMLECLNLVKEVHWPTEAKLCLRRLVPLLD